MPVLHPKLHRARCAQGLLLRYVAVRMILTILAPTAFVEPCKLLPKGKFALLCSLQGLIELLQGYGKLP